MEISGIGQSCPRPRTSPAPFHPAVTQNSAVRPTPVQIYRLKNPQTFLPLTSSSPTPPPPCGTENSAGPPPSCANYRIKDPQIFWPLNCLSPDQSCYLTSGPIAGVPNPRRCYGQIRTPAFHLRCTTVPRHRAPQFLALLHAYGYGPGLGSRRGNPSSGRHGNQAPHPGHLAAWLGMHLLQ